MKKKDEAESSYEIIEIKRKLFKELTYLEYVLVDFIFCAHGAPSIQDLHQLTRKSKTHIYGSLRNLIKKNIISVKEGRPRTYLLANGFFDRSKFVCILCEATFEAHEGEGKKCPRNR